MQLIALETCPTRRAGGQELSLFETCRALSERGATVTLLYAEPGDLLDEYAGFCQATYAVSSRYVSTCNWPRFLADVARTLWRTRTQGPTVVYGNRYFDLPFACALGRVLRARVCCHLRVPAPPYLSRQYRLGMRLADACITTSHATRESYITRGAPADKLHVVPNGVDTDYFTPVGEASERIRLPGLPADAAVALFAGRLCADKGVDVLLDALTRVRERGVNLHVVIAAPPARTTAEREYGHDLRMQADRLDLSDCVHFTGHVADMVWLYHSVDVLVLPSRCEETFGRVLIEAMACGVPAVGSAVGGIPEVLAGEFARGCVPSEDPAALAAVLAEQLDWRTRDPELAQRCRAYVVERFPQGKAMERVAAILFPGGLPVMAGTAVRNVRAEAECEACVL